jgi:murein DD-endopeptidase MepM/ murein hydrolase activator NlpD
LGDVKALLVAPLAVLVGVALLPVVLAGGDPPPATGCAQAAGPIAIVLATIRAIESGGDYQAHASGSTASGAYQFLDSTWAGYGGYRRAADAPADAQDVKAATYAQAILDAHNGDVTAVPVAWYIGHVPAAASPEWDDVPAPSAGNQLTPRQYQTKWMATYQQLLDDSTDGDSEPAAPTSTDQTAACSPTSYAPGGAATSSTEGWAFPLPRAVVNPSQLDDPHHDYPAADLLVPEGTPVYALTNGTVVRITDFAHNWWTDNCPHPGCDPCGIGLSVETGGGLRYIYCHGSQTHVHLGDAVSAGQHVLDSGNTGQSGAPHLHVELKVDGARHCPQTLLQQVYVTGVGPDPAELPTTGCTF